MITNPAPHWVFSRRWGTLVSSTGGKVQCGASIVRKKGGRPNLLRSYALLGGLGNKELLFEGSRNSEWKLFKVATYQIVLAGTVWFLSLLQQQEFWGVISVLVLCIDGPSLYVQMLLLRDYRHRRTRATPQCCRSLCVSSSKLRSANGWPN